MADQIVVVDPVDSSRERPLYRGTQIAWYIFYAVETLLLFRFVLRLLGANPAAEFTQFIYALSYPFVAPFLYVFRASTAGGAVFEWSTLLAMAVYWVVVWGIIRLIVMSKPVSHAEAHDKLSRQDVA